MTRKGVELILLVNLDLGSADFERVFFHKKCLFELINIQYKNYADIIPRPRS